MSYSAKNLSVFKDNKNIINEISFDFPSGSYVSIIGPNRASLFLHLIPIFSSIWAISFLNEKFTFFHLIGVLFILSGCFIPKSSIKSHIFLTI